VTLGQPIKAFINGHLSLPACVFSDRHWPVGLYVLYASLLGIVELTNGQITSSIVWIETIEQRSPQAKAFTDQSDFPKSVAFL
jgi:hypothetical protein